MSFLRSRINRVIAASWLLWAEAGIVISLGVYLFYKGITANESVDYKALIVEIIYYVIGSLVIAFMARSIRNQKRFAFAPSILINLIAIGVSKYMLDGGRLYLAIPTFLIGVISVILIGSLVSQ